VTLRQRRVAPTIVARVALLLLLAAPALADEDAPLVQARPKLTPPKLEKRVEAVYPPEALRLGLSATVTLELELDEKGAVTSVTISEKAGHSFDEAAVAAVKQFHFTPTLSDGTPIPSRVTYAYKFTLSEKRVVNDVVRFKGGVFLRGTRAPVAGGKVNAVGAAGIFTAEIDERGRFEIKCPPGKYHVVAIGPRARRFEHDETIGEKEALTVNYFIEPSQYTRYESTVRADVNREEISRVQLTTEELLKIPGTGGDALRAIENLPGAARAPFNSGLLIVRGGKPTDSRVFLSGAEVPQLYHFGGFTSVLPTELISNIDYLPGNFSARFGRATAGVIDVDLREPRRDRWHGSLETSVFDAGFTAEGPVGKGGMVLGARRSIIDALLPALDLPGLQFTAAPVYYDYQAMLDYPVGGGHLRLLVSGSDDQLKLVFSHPQDQDPLLSAFGTHIYYHKLQIRWTRTVGKWSFFLQNSTGVTGQSGTLGRSLSFDVFSVGSDFRLEARYVFSRHLKLLAGVDTQYANVALGARIPAPPHEGQLPSPISATNLIPVDERLNVFNLGAYLEAQWKPIDRFAVTPGIRLDYYSPLIRLSFDPRLTARLQLAKYTWLKAGLGLYSQDPQPPDYDPHFGNPRLGPEHSIHAALTVEQGLYAGLMLEVTGFYKHLYDLVTTNNNLVLSNGVPIAERVGNDGIGRIYGGEILLRQQLSRWFFGWISYTLMRSERKDCAACDWRLFDFDQTHILIVALHAYLPKGFEVGIRFRYISGNPYTPNHGGFYDADTDVYSPAAAPGSINTARLDAFHQLDLRVDKTFLFKTWLLKIFLDLQNVYNHQSAELNQYNYDFTRNQPITGLPIIPGFGIRSEF
jgi:TonB family protein